MKTTQIALPDAPGTIAAPEAPPQIDLSMIFERLAANPDINVEKLQALMEMQRSILQDRAKVAFNAAMSEAQSEMRPVVKDAENQQTRSWYASYEAMDRAMRPVYSKHGFALSFNTEESRLAEHVCVTCLVSHRAGYERSYRVEMPADGKGAKGGDVMTKTHAAGSAMQYGMRYLLKLIFNVATSDGDDDGNEAGRQEAPPDGYEGFMLDFAATAQEGLKALTVAFNEAQKSTVGKAHLSYLTKHERPKWEALKAKAAKVSA